MFTDIGSTTIFFTAGIIIIFDVSLIMGFGGRGKKETSPMVRKINYFWSKNPLILCVTVSGSLVRLPSASFLVAVLNAYPEMFIVKLLIASTSLSNFSSFSLVNIASKFSICEMDAWLNTSSVTLFASVINFSSSYIITFKIAF